LRCVGSLGGPPPAPRGARRPPPPPPPVTLTEEILDFGPDGKGSGGRGPTFITPYIL
jgi:hypothetical protein